MVWLKRRNTSSVLFLLDHLHPFIKSGCKEQKSWVTLFYLLMTMHSNRGEILLQYRLLTIHSKSRIFSNKNFAECLLFSKFHANSINL